VNAVGLLIKISSITDSRLAAFASVLSQFGHEQSGPQKRPRRKHGHSSVRHDPEHVQDGWDGAGADMTITFEIINGRGPCRGFDRAYIAHTAVSKTAEIVYTII
jgi:hypothetical protein